MSAARPVGDIIDGVLQRCCDLSGHHKIILGMDGNACRKSYIMDLRETGEITWDECALMLEAYGVQAA